jgi:subfamily B ATP-binding cassette protein MsbA
MVLVTQHTFLFNDSVKNNIAYGHTEKSFEDVVRAAQAAHADGFIRALPLGYDTVIGESGVKLSGGQRQRIAIARALLKDAPILILDEATSSLDTESEREVQNALDALMRGRTSFVIAHRLSTIMNADRIIVLKGGRIVEEGRHDELLRRRGEYKNLYDQQFREEQQPGKN